MSIRITTLAEADRMQEVAKKYGELCEVQRGPALKDYWCDNSGEFIPKGTECAAVLLLPDDKHPNYEHQKNMLKEYVS